MKNQILKSATTFYKDKGLFKTVQRIIFVVWYNRLHTAEYILRLSQYDLQPLNVEINKHVSIHRVNSKSTMPEQLLHQYKTKFGQYRGEESVVNQFKRRIRKAAELWLRCIDGDIANTVWAIKGGYIEPFFFPIREDEVIFFDVFTFDNYRGLGLLRDSLNYAENTYISENISAFYTTVKTWNKASIRAINKANYEIIGEASKVNIFGKPLVYWHK